MTDDRLSRFRALMAELDAAHIAYRNHLPPAQVLGTTPILPRTVDWDAWDRDKERFDAAHEAVLSFLRGEAGEER
jgi:hypothetical protein